MKCIVAISIAFFIFSCNNKKDPGLCIKNIVAQDSILGKARNQNCKTHSLSETITRYAADLEKLDFTGCPDSFRIAFIQHNKAWRNLIPVTDKYPSLRGEMHALFEQLKAGADSSRFNALLNQVWSTWADVEWQVKEQIVP